MALSPYDQQVYDAGFKFIPQTQYLQNPFLIPEDQVTANPNTGAGIVTLQPSGGGGIPFTGGISDLTSAFQKTVDDRQNRLKELNYPYRDGNVFFPGQTGDPIVMEQLAPYGAPEDFYKGTIEGVPQTIKGAPGIVDIKPASLSRKIQEGIYSLPFLSKPQSADQIMEEGYSPRFKGILGSIFPDRYSTLPRYDQAFIAANMGYTGPTVFGQDQSGLYKDPFGFNVRSAFGNYGEKVGKEAQKSGDALVESAAKRGLTFDKSKGALVDAAGNVIDQDDYDASMLDFINQTKFLRNKFNYFTQKTLERDALKKEEFEKPGGTKDQVADLQAKINAGEFDSTSDKPDRDLGSVTKESAAKTSGVGGGGYTKSDTKRDDRRGGQYGFMDGGIVDMLEIYD